MNFLYNIMEYSEDVSFTPYFGKREYNTTLIEKLLGRKNPKSANDVFKYVKNKKEYNSKNKEKSMKKNKSKEKSESKGKSLKSKNEKISGLSLPIEQKYENLFDIFLKKKIQLRNDFDQNNSEKFLSEKEFAFQQFQMNENADFLDN